MAFKDEMKVFMELAKQLPDDKLEQLVEEIRQKSIQARQRRNERLKSRKNSNRYDFSAHNKMEKALDK